VQIEFFAAANGAEHLTCPWFFGPTHRRSIDNEKPSGILGHADENPAGNPRQRPPITWRAGAFG